MKIKKSQLRQIIQEEIIEFLEEAVVYGGQGDPRLRQRVATKAPRVSIPRADVSRMAGPAQRAAEKMKALHSVTRAGQERLRTAKKEIEILKTQDPDIAAALDDMIYMTDQSSLKQYGESFFGQIPNFMGWQKTT